MLVLKIKDRTYAVESAVLFAEIRPIDQARSMWGSTNKGIAWFLEIGTPEDTTDNLDEWNPFVTCICKFPRLHWREIEGKVLEWTDAWDTEMANGRSCLWIFDSPAPIHSNRLEFSRRSEDTFAIRWQGLCDLNWDEEYGANLEFLIETRVKFLGIAIYEQDLATATQMLSSFQDSNDFVEGSIARYAPGSVRQFVPRLRN